MLGFDRYVFIYSYDVILASAWEQLTRNICRGWRAGFSQGNIHRVCLHYTDITSLMQVNLCQKRLFLHQLTHDMTKDCSLNYQFSTRKLQAQNMLGKQIVLNVKTKPKYNLLLFWTPFTWSNFDPKGNYRILWLFQTW
jgi:hypothetical protein